ncbi:hypothetical protein H6F43_11855, partial [Leptolyngbya sp. FACHB-36]|nr:hypothetical protein [Leptolyngbya sp. FACHB-36]
AASVLEVYQLQAGRYELQTANADDRYWIASMNLFLGVWQGTKEARTGAWLRWWDAAGSLLLWAVERVEVVETIAEQERQRAEQERQQKERLMAYLRSQGIDPNTLL